MSFSSFSSSRSFAFQRRTGLPVVVVVVGVAANLLVLVVVAVAVVVIVVVVKLRRRLVLVRRDGVRRTFPTVVRRERRRAELTPAARSASTSAAWLSHMRCCERGAMSLMNSVSFGSAAMASSISFSKASFFARFIFLSSRTPMNRSASAALASRAARSSGVSCVLRCAEDPSECLLHGRGSCADLTALAYSTCTLLVSMKVLWKYSSALTASAVVLYPTKAIWRDLPSLEMVRRRRRRRRRRRQRGVRGRGHGGRRG